MCDLCEQRVCVMCVSVGDSCGVVRVVRWVVCACLCCVLFCVLSMCVCLFAMMCGM